jgi:hypothetical protein
MVGSVILLCCDSALCVQCLCTCSCVKKFTDLCIDSSHGTVDTHHTYRARRLSNRSIDFDASGVSLDTGLTHSNILAEAYTVGVESAKNNALSMSFILDSGASRHMASSVIALTNEVKCEMRRG